MKYSPLVLVLSLGMTFTTPNSVAAQSVAPRVIDSELGLALGFYAYRYEADLAQDEALVVRELVTAGTRRTEAEYIVIGRGPKAAYDLVIVDSGFFHPSLRNTYMLRFPTSIGSVDDVALMGHTHGPEFIEFIFSDPQSLQVKLTRRWSAVIEKQENVRKRWPELPNPQPGYLVNSRRLIADNGPASANPAAATPTRVSTRTFNDASAASSTAPFQADGLEMLKAGAAKDNVAAQVALAATYFSGNGVAKDFMQAAHWWRKAAESGDATAQHDLAAMYANGFGVGQDWVAARTWYLKAAAQGDARSQSNLGANYANGRGGPVDMDQALFWTKKAADQGLPSSECDLGVMYETGLGVPKDVAQALVWYRRAARQGDARAQAALNRLSVTGPTLR